MILHLLQIWPVCVTVPNRSLCFVAVQQCHCHPAVHDGTAAASVHSLLWPNTTAATAWYGPRRIATRGRSAPLNTFHKSPSTDGKIVHCETLVVTQPLCTCRLKIVTYMCHIGFLAYFVCASKSLFLHFDICVHMCVLIAEIPSNQRSWLTHNQSFWKLKSSHICGWPRKTFPRPACFKACFKECRYGITQKKARYGLWDNSKKARYGLFQRKPFACFVCLVCGSLFHI